MDNLENNNLPKKFDFKHKKDCVIHSIKEVECFLRKINKACRYIDLYKIIK